LNFYAAQESPAHWLISGKTSIISPNSGSPVKIQCRLHLGNNQWIVAAWDGTNFIMVKIQVTGAGTYDWISTLYQTSAEVPPACLIEATFTESCFVGIQPGKDAFPVNLWTLEAMEPRDDITCVHDGKNNFCVGWENSTLSCYGSGSECLENSCSQDSDCAVDSQGSPNEMWKVRCVERGSFLYAGDMCEEFEDAPGHFIFDAATESCGIPELSPSLPENKGKCTIGASQVVPGCKPKLVKNGYQCSTGQVVGSFGKINPPNRHQGRRSLGGDGTLESCVKVWSTDPNCCGTRIDFDEVTGQCYCADTGSQYNWWCQDDRIEPQQPIPSQYGRDAGRTDTRAVYDIGHCVNPYLHDCPVDPGEYKGDPCKNLVSATLNPAKYSNLGDQGPDAGDGLLFPDVTEVKGESVDLQIVAPGFQSFKAEKNGATNGIGNINVLSGTSTEVVFKFINKNEEEVDVEGLAVTFLDLDEGKRGRSRTTVSSCEATDLNVGSELKKSEEDSCLSTSSAKKGNAANNPQSLDGLTEDHKSRAATFMFSGGSTFKFQIGLSAGPKGRNVNFVLSPVLGCD